MQKGGSWLAAATEPAVSYLLSQPRPQFHTLTLSCSQLLPLASFQSLDSVALVSDCSGSNHGL